MTNPFTPTFGMVPPYLAGREVLLADFHRAFESGYGDPNLSAILIGPRGSGKTALLSCIGGEAREAGWIVVDSVAAEGLLEDIYQQALIASAEMIGKRENRHLTGISIGSFLGLSWTTETGDQGNWRARMGELLKKLGEREIGLLITVDEVRSDVPELIQLASVYQLFLREQKKVALVMAGLPAYVTDLVNHEVVSFLRRSRQHYLGLISDADIRNAFRRTILDGGKDMEENALNDAVRAIGGFAYMMQLVGFSIWEASGNDSEITEEHARKGISWAETDFRNGVLNSTYRELSRGDIAFLQAMLADPEFSRLSDVAERLGKTPGYASAYKARLLRAGVLEEQENKTFSIAIPLFREYLAEKLN